MRDVLGLDALSLLRDRSFAVFVLAAFLFCIPLTLYFGFAAQFLQDSGVPNVVRAMTLGQVSEIVAMLVMPFFLAWMGVKWVFVVGMAAWVLRYGLFYLGYGGQTLWPHYTGVAIHGVCYVFFFVLAYVYVDKKAPAAIRTKAQGFIALVTLGLGFFFGSMISGFVVQENTTAASALSKAATHWDKVWGLAAMAGAVIMVLFALLFRYKEESKPAPTA
jgi:hypothetical protein